MKAVQIGRYSKTIDTILRNIPVPELDPTEVLLQVKAAAVNPLELLILTGSVKLIQDYPMPLTLGNECSGVVKAVGRGVTDFHVGDRVYARLPLFKIGAFAEYVAVDQSALAVMPTGYDFATAAAKKQDKEYHFIFVRSDGAQLREITKIVEQHHIVPRIDPRVFTLETAQDALALVQKGATDGKVLISLEAEGNEQ